MRGRIPPGPVWVLAGLALIGAGTRDWSAAGTAAARAEQVSGPAQRLSGNVQGAVGALEAQGYTVVATAEGDFDGDGTLEVATSLADATMLSDEVGFLARSEAGRALPARVVLLRPNDSGAAPWTELPRSGGVGEAAAVFDKLAALALVEDSRPELLVGAYQPLMGNTGEGDAYVYAYRDGAFREIWRIEGESWRWARIAHCEIARACEGRELVVAHAPEDPYHLHNRPQHFQLSAYGYRGDRYELLSRRLTIGRYHSADEALEALAHGCRRF
ncbi:MAG: hypothetical protein FJX75_20000 [Armatimonadetes bacterium]|nr:hypothetical protein [Armatimonadota bacterium]